MVTGEPTDEQLQLIRTRKPEAPVIEVEMGDGSKKKLWCTFGPQQIDIDPFSKPGETTQVASLAVAAHTQALLAAGFVPCTELFCKPFEFCYK